MCALSPQRLLFLAVCGFACTSGANPLRVDPLPAQVVEQPEPSSRRIWHTRRFRIESKVALPDHELRKLAVVADTTVRVIEQYPLPIYSPPGDGRFRMIILPDDASYLAEGGVLGSAGMYLGRKRCVIFHAQHLFASTRSRLSPQANEDLIVHEVAHLAMHGTQRLMPQWLNEGLCEYFAAAHQGAGRFRDHDLDRSIREHILSRHPETRPIAPIVAVGDLASLDAQQWQSYLNRLHETERIRAYSTALLLTHYHLHGGSPRRELIEAELRHRNPTEKPPLTVVSDERSEIQTRLVRYWSSRGLKLSIAPEFPLPSRQRGSDPFVPPR